MTPKWSDVKRPIQPPLRHLAPPGSPQKASPSHWSFLHVNLIIQPHNCERTKAYPKLLNQQRQATEKEMYWKAGRSDDFYVLPQGIVKSQGIDLEGLDIGRAFWMPILILVIWLNLSRPIYPLIVCPTDHHLEPSCMLFPHFLCSTDHPADHSLAETSQTHQFHGTLIISLGTTIRKYFSKHLPPVVLFALEFVSWKHFVFSFAQKGCTFITCMVKLCSKKITRNWENLKLCVKHKERSCPSDESALSFCTVIC